MRIKISLNSHLISEKKSQTDRINVLAKEAYRQYKSLIIVDKTEKQVQQNNNKSIII